MQDLPNAAVHSAGARHAVRLAPGSRLKRLAGAGRIEVASFHHQALGGPGDGVLAAGWSDDGVLEAVEIPDRRFAVGVQWHPEREPDARVNRGLFGGFCAAARDYREERA